MTFDIGVLNVSRTRIYKIPANRYAMVYLDPTRKPEQDGLIHAPVISFDQSVDKFA
jgi:hypothetical protein